MYVCISTVFVIINVHSSQSGRGSLSAPFVCQEDYGGT
jgi:hypothetical protein